MLVELKYFSTQYEPNIDLNWTMNVNLMVKNIFWKQSFFQTYSFSPIFASVAWKCFKPRVLKYLNLSFGTWILSDLLHLTYSSNFSLGDEFKIWGCRKVQHSPTKVFHNLGAKYCFISWWLKEGHQSICIRECVLSTIKLVYI